MKLSTLEPTSEVGLVGVAWLAIGRGISRALVRTFHALSGIAAYAHGRGQRLDAPAAEDDTGIEAEYPVAPRERPAGVVRLNQLMHPLDPADDPTKLSTARFEYGLFDDADGDPGAHAIDQGTGQLDFLTDIEVRLGLESNDHLVDPLLDDLRTENAYEGLERVRQD
jgi:hypothetical protein